MTVNDRGVQGRGHGNAGPERVRGVRRRGAAAGLDSRGHDALRDSPQPTARPAAPRPPALPGARPRAQRRGLAPAARRAHRLPQPLPQRDPARPRGRGSARGGGRLLRAPRADGGRAAAGRGALQSESRGGRLPASRTSWYLVPSVEQRDFRARLEDLGVRVAGVPQLPLRSRCCRTSRSWGRWWAVRAGGEGPGGGDRGAAGGDLECRRDVLQGPRSTSRRASSSCYSAIPSSSWAAGTSSTRCSRASGSATWEPNSNDPYPSGLDGVADREPRPRCSSTSDPNASGRPSITGSSWGAIPAVANERLIALDPELISMPGPYLDAPSTSSRVRSGVRRSRALLPAARRELAQPPRPARRAEPGAGDS